MRSEKTALVIHPDSGVLDSFEDTLTGEGFQVFRGQNLDDFWQVLEESQPDVALVGILLEDGTSTRLFADPRSKGLAVIGMAGVFGGQTVRRLLQERYPFLGLVEPPYSGADLVELLRLHFGPDYPDAISAGIVDDSNAVTPGWGSDRTWIGSGPVPSQPLEESARSEDLPATFERVRTSQITSLPNGVPSPLNWREVPDQGRLSEVDFSVLMARLLHTRHTGSLYLWRKRVRKIATFDQGRPVAVRSNLLFECLGSLLVNEGVVDEEVSNEALGRARTEGIRQGEVLVSMGVIDEAELSAALKRQLELRLLDVFSWSDARFQVESSDEVRTLAPLDRDESQGLIIRGVMEQVPLEKVLKALEPCMSLRLRLAQPVEQVLELGFDESYRDIFDELSQERALLELIAQFEQVAHVHRVIYALLSLGVISCQV